MLLLQKEKNSRRRVNASGPEAPSSRARNTCPKRGAVVGLSGVMVRSKYLRRGYPHPGTHVADRKPSELRSSHSVGIPNRQDLIVRTSCCVACDWFIEEGKARVKIRSISLRGVVTYSCFTQKMCFASAAAAAASIAEVRAWATLYDTDLAIIGHDQLSKKLSRGC